jgi:hypothetical protein
VLVLDFLLDWTFEPSRATRAWMAGGCLIAIVWAWRTHLSPLRWWRETDLDMALLVERQQRIDSDLVAAMQFDSADADRWGSAGLRRAVVEYVGEFGREVNVFAGFTWRPLTRRAALLAGGLLAAGLLAVLFPGYLTIFLDRLCLGHGHYPTRTRIERMTFNGRELLAEGLGQVAPCAEGRPVEISVEGGGDQPSFGHARLTGMTSGTRAEVVLQSVADATSIGSQPTSVYTGQLPRLDEDADIQVYLGDAWTDPIRLRIVPLPVVQVELRVTPPVYAAVGDHVPEPGETDVSVLEGSRVDPVVRCANKPLRRAWLTMDGTEHALQPDDAAGTTWMLAARHHAPLAAIRRTQFVQVQVVDRDGLSLAHPIECSIRPRPDRPPRVNSHMVTLRVVPSARPTISYQADDDFGLARLQLNLSVVRDGAIRATATRPLPLDDTHPVRQRGEVPIDLSELDLAKGDRLTCAVEAADYRGDAPGRATTSEPIQVEVTDERGVLSAMLESDERLAEQLDAVIERQIDVGEMP